MARNDRLIGDMRVTWITVAVIVILGWLMGTTAIVDTRPRM